MSETTELTYSDVATHSSKKDLYVVIHDKVYNVSSFVDEHPGGEEVLLDVGGQDATEAFEDVGHSDEAREILDGLLIGNLKRKPGDPAPSAPAPPTKLVSQNNQNAGGLGIGVYAIGLAFAALAFGIYTYLQKGADAQGTK